MKSGGKGKVTKMRQWQYPRGDDLFNHNSSKSFIVRAIRELYWYGDITTSQFYRYMSMVRSKDIGLCQLLRIILRTYENLNLPKWVC